MPVARIITTDRENLEDLCAELRQAGYTVEFAAPGDSGAGADMVLAADVVNAEDAMGVAARSASALGADVVIAPGVVIRDKQLEDRRAEHLAEQQRLIAEAREREERERQEREWRRQEKEFAAQQRLIAETREREERERQERERRRQEEELAAQQRLMAEAREREEREQQERERRRQEEELAAQQRLMAEAREREEREHQERERRRQEKELAAQQRLMAEAREREERECERRAAAETVERARRTREAERVRSDRERVSPREPALARKAESGFTASAEPTFAAVRIAEVQTTPVLGPRSSRRQQRLQRATLLASVAALLLMLGFAAALRLRPEPPLSPNVVQNPAQQEVPFGPAHITPQPAAAPATVAPRKPSPAARPEQHGRRPARDGMAEDEVIVHHYGETGRQTALSRTSGGIRHYSDQ